MLNSAENEICSAYKKINTNYLNFFSCKAELSMKLLLPINIKMPTLVSILIFIGWKNFMLIWVEYEKSFYNLGTWRLALRVLLQVPLFASNRSIRIPKRKYDLLKKQMHSYNLFSSTGLRHEARGINIAHSNR